MLLNPDKPFTPPPRNPGHSLLNGKKKTQWIVTWALTNTRVIYEDRVGLRESSCVMAFELFSVTSVLTLLLLFIMSRLQLFHNRQTAKKPTHQDLEISSPDQSRLCKSLASALTTSVVFPQDDATFKQSMNSYWAQQEREVIPACVVQPRDAQQLSTAITVLKREHDKRLEANGENQNEGLFAVRSGGHSPVPGAASIKGGVVIDMSLICEVKPSEDGSSVTIGAGAKWKDVSTILDEKGLAVVGGRNSAVGVGGLTLGGKFR